jgi:hypothetical protein
MAYADDVVIMGRRLQEAEEVITSQVEKTNNMGLDINSKRTKLLTITNALQ